MARTKRARKRRTQHETETRAKDEEKYREEENGGQEEFCQEVARYPQTKEDTLDSGGSSSGVDPRCPAAEPDPYLRTKNVLRRGSRASYRGRKGHQRRHRGTRQGGNQRAELQYGEGIYLLYRRAYRLQHKGSLSRDGEILSGYPTSLTRDIVKATYVRIR